VIMERVYNFAPGYGLGTQPGLLLVYLGGAMGVNIWLLKIVTPLLIASFAFNFNNFNLIFLLTGGGPRNELDGQIAGATDILISYTYKIAFGTNVQDLGLASAISVIIFIIIASISLFGVRKSKVLDSFS